MDFSYFAEPFHILFKLGPYPIPTLNRLKTNIYKQTKTHNPFFTGLTISCVDSRDSVPVSISH